MILSTHAIFGAAVASLVPSHPVTGFTLGFVSHYVLDAIPHRDYDLISLKIGLGEKMKPIDIIRNKFQFTRDVMLVSLDALVGFCLAFLFFFDPIHPWVFFLGAGASMAPDFFLFLFLIVKHKPLASLFHFHASVIHSKVVLALGQLAGITLQFLTVVTLIAIIYGVRNLFI